MRSCKRACMNEKNDSYEIPTGCSEEEIQRLCEFMLKLKNVDDETIFDQYVNAMKSYVSWDLRSDDLKRKVFSILRGHDDLLKDFFQLLSDLNSLGRNFKATSESLNAWLDHETKTLLFDSCLQKAKHDFETNQEDEKCEYGPSYLIRPEAEAEAEEGSSSDGILNNKYFSVGDIDPMKVKIRKLSRKEVNMNTDEDNLMERDILFYGIVSVIEFAEEGFRKPPRFNDVVKFVYKKKKLRVPRIFQTDSILAVKAILPELKSLKESMEEARELSARSAYNEA